MSASASTQEQINGTLPANPELDGDHHLSATEAAMECFRIYAKERPESVALWAFGIGFVLGWKLKPW